MPTGIPSFRLRRQAIFHRQAIYLTEFTFVSSLRLRDRTDQQEVFMIRKQGLQGGFALLLSTSLLLAGCTTALVRDDVKYPKTGAHCSGSQGVDDSSIAVLPVPVVAFVVPHANLHDIKADDYLKRCGDSTKEGLINSRCYSERCAWADPQGECGGHPLVRAPLPGAHAPSGGPLSALRHTCSTFPPTVADAPDRDSPSRS